MSYLIFCIFVSIWGSDLAQALCIACKGFTLEILNCFPGKTINRVTNDDLGNRLFDT